MQKTIPRAWRINSYLTGVIGLFAMSGMMFGLTSNEVDSQSQALSLALGATDDVHQLERTPARKAGANAKNYLSAFEPESVRISNDEGLVTDSAIFAYSNVGTASSASDRALSFTEFSEKITKQTPSKRSGSSSSSSEMPAAEAPIAVSTESEGKTLNDTVPVADRREVKKVTVPTLFPRPYEDTFSDRKLLLFFPVGEGGTLSGGNYLLPVYEASGFQPPKLEGARSSATYRTLP